MFYRRLIVPDTHTPWHDAGAWRVLTEFTHDFKPNEIVVLGDFFDLAVCSRFTKDPTLVPQLLSEETGPGSEMLEDLLLTADTQKLVFLEGNHEYRIKSYLAERAPAFANQFSSKELLSLPAKTHLIPYGVRGIYKMPGWIATHGSLFNKHVAQSMLQLFGCNVIFGHVHRFQHYTSRNVHGDILQAITPGWLGDVEKAGSYQKNAVSEWNHGFSFGGWKRSGIAFMQNVLLQHGEAVIGGKLYP